MVTEAEYVSLAQSELALIIEALDELDSDDFDAELENDIITIEFNDADAYIINSHRAARQIWMAAARRAWHFEWRGPESGWRSDKDPEAELWTELSKALADKLGKKHFSLR